MRNSFSIAIPVIRSLLLFVVAATLFIGGVFLSTQREKKDTFLRDIKAFQLLSAFVDRGSQTARGSAEHYSARLQARFPMTDSLSSNLVPLTGTTASLTMADRDLNDATYGILSNATKKGIAWERPGLFTLYREGEIIFQSRVGVRLHGSEFNRANASEALGFRLYFRAAYGSETVPAATVWPAVPGTLRVMVLVNTTNNLRSAMSMDITRSAGAATPYAMPAQFVFNGAEWHTHSVIITEHISKNYLMTHYGHDDFLFYRYKNDDSKYAPGPYAALLARVKDRDTPLSFREIAGEVDTKTLFAQYATNMLLKLYDSFQGGIIRDNKTYDARWTFISWDLEGGFWTSWGCQMLSDECPESMESYLQHMGNRWGLLRESIWQRFKDDETFRQEFARYLARLFRHHITDEWISDLTDRYRKMAVSNGLDYEGDYKYGVASFAASERFLRNQRIEIAETINKLWGIDINRVSDHPGADESPSAGPATPE